MEEGLKKRLIGATVLVSLVVIFVPMLLENGGKREGEAEISNIPPRPDRPFTREVLPQEGQSLAVPPTIVRLQPREQEVPSPARPRYNVEPLPTARSAAPTQAAAAQRSRSKPVVRAKPQPKPAPSAQKPPQQAPVSIPPPRLKERAGGAPRRAPISSWVIQLGSFSSRKNADKLVRQLRANSFSAFVAQASVKGKLVYRVRVGPEADRRQAEKTLTRLNRAMKSQGIKGSIRRYP